MTMRSVASVTLVFVVGASALLGCEAPTCSLSATEACACAGGGTGLRTCGSDETFGPCVCVAALQDAGPADDAAADDASEVPLADGGTADATPVDGSVAVDPPRLEVACVRGVACNAANPMLDAPCRSLAFGAVDSVASPPCELVVELRNHARNAGRGPGELVVSDLSFPLRDLDTGRAVDGALAGFSVLDAVGQPLSVTPATPLRIAVPAGADVGAARLRLRFDGSYPGALVGAGARGDGFRIASNDPDQLSAAVTLTAQGSHPEIAATPPALDFGASTAPSRQTVTLRNVGSWDLRISSVGLRTGAAFSVTTQPVLPVTLPPQGTTLVEIAYGGTMSAQDELLVTSNDPAQPVLSIPVVAGLVPHISVNPRDVLPLSGSGSSGTVEITNVGSGDLVVLTLIIEGPGGDITHSSVDDFSIDGCTTNPCTLAVNRVCPAAQPGCLTPVLALTVRYNNNDLSTTDLAQLRIVSNDPTDPESIVVLSATDTPCFNPTPAIGVMGTSFVVGAPVALSAAPSSPGAAPITAYAWSFIFSPSAPPPDITPPGAEQVSFVPPVSGVYVVSLDVTNACGASSGAPATEVINVQ